MKWTPVFLAAMAIAPCTAHEPITTRLTFTQEISRILYKRCFQCHRDGGSAPMPLVTYEQARPWAKAIRDEVLARRMPPWGAVSGVGEFRDDPSLSQPEMDMIVSWVEGGAPEGDPIYLPKPPASGATTSMPSLRRVIEVGAGASQALTAPITVAAIRPERLPDGGSLEVAAERPDGSIERLIWIRDYRVKFARTYWLATPLELPRGSSIAAFGDAPARAALLLIGR